MEYYKLLSRLAPQIIDPKPKSTFKERCEFFVFNMFDCVEDLENAATLSRNPKRFSRQVASSRLTNLLVHTWYHLATAAALCGNHRNPFQKDLRRMLPKKRS